MNAPDKIYASFMNNGRVTVGCWCSVYPIINSSEYIRKEALLKWIDEYKNYSSGPSLELLKTHIETL